MTLLERRKAKRAKLMKDERYRKVLSNLKTVAETKKVLSTLPDKVMAWYNQAIKEEKAQLKFKKALEEGDELTITVEDIDSGADEEFEGDEEFSDEGGPDEVVEMEKEMKRIQSQLNKLKGLKK